MCSSEYLSYYQLVPSYSFLVHFFFVCSEAEKNARDEQAQLKDAIEAEKVRTEEDTTTASMEIARLKDDLLESR